MRQEQFEAFLPCISADLVAYICEKEQIPEEKAIEGLYSSKLYAMLEREDTKVWYYSTPMLYSLYMQEKRTGHIEFPDV